MRTPAIIGTALAALALAAGAAAASWTWAASLPASDQVTFAQPSLAFAADGRGVLVWDSYPDLRTTRYGAISATGARREAVRLPFAIDAMAPLPGGRAFVLGAPAGGGDVSYALLGPGARASLRPAIAARYPSQQAVLAANAAGTAAILGASGGQAVLTVCDARLRCGPTIPLSGSQGTIGENGDAGQPGLAVAIAPDGRVLAAFLHDGRLVARWRAPGGRLGPLLRLARPRSQTWLAAAVSGAGRGEIAWETQDVRNRSRPGPATSPTTIAVATAPAGGAFAAPVTVDGFPASPAVAGPADATLAVRATVAAAFDGARPLVAWTGHGAGGFDIRVADADAPASTTQTLSSPAADAALGALATAPGDGALVAWSSPAGDEAALAPPGGPFGAAVTLAPSLAADSYYSRPVAAAIDPASGAAWVAGVVGSAINLWRAP